MITVTNGEKRSGTSCTSCDSKDEVSEYKVGNEYGAIGFRLCKTCKRDMTILLQDDNKELKKILDTM